MLAVGLVGLVIAGYNMVYFLINWMPSDWSFDDTRTFNLKKTISMILGPAFAVLVFDILSTGTKARTELSEFKLRSYMDELIKESDVNTLEKLREEMELAKHGESLLGINNLINRKINESTISYDNLYIILVESTSKIDRALRERARL